MTELYTSVGQLHYSDDWKLILNVDQDLADYYRALIPKWMPNNRPRWGAHVTLVRQNKEQPVNKEHWYKYQGEKIKFQYSPIVDHGKIYFWLNIYCIRFEEIRIELGMPVHSIYTLPPEGFKKTFHCTIANMKDWVEGWKLTPTS